MLVNGWGSGSGLVYTSEANAAWTLMTMYLPLITSSTTNDQNVTVPSLQREIKYPSKCNKSFNKSVSSSPRHKLELKD